VKILYANLDGVDGEWKDNGWRKFSAQSLREIYKQVCRYLSIGGTRCIDVFEAPSFNSAIRMSVSLYENESFIADKSGRIIYTA
jgi:hypothetical protein